MHIFLLTYIIKMCAFVGTKRL